MRRSSRPVARGFTLIEILTTIVIVGVLTAIAVPIGQLTLIRQQETNLKTALKETRKAIDGFHDRYGCYPAFWRELRGESDNYPIVFMREAPPPNPFTNDQEDWLVVTSGTTEFNAIGLYQTSTQELIEHNKQIAAQNGLAHNAPGCPGYWAIYDIRYPREDRVAINETFYTAW